MGGRNRNQKPAGEHEVNLEELQKLVDMLAAREVTEFEMERNGLRIRFRRDRASSNSQAVADASSGLARPEALASPPAMPPSAAASASTEFASAPAVSPNTALAEDVFVIKSPIVGTFYGSPAPTALPFVKVHDIVQVGQVLCIVEAMKLMNEIESEVAGEIVRIYIENGQPVEYGQPLFAIQPSRAK